MKPGLVRDPCLKPTTPVLPVAEAERIARTLRPVARLKPPPERPRGSVVPRDAFEAERAADRDKTPRAPGMSASLNKTK
jgi:hypothetical protein